MARLTKRPPLDLINIDEIRRRLDISADGNQVDIQVIVEEMLRRIEMVEFNARFHPMVDLQIDESGRWSPVVPGERFVLWLN